MQTLRTVLFILFVVDSILLVIAVLIQSGRGGGLAGALGGIGGADSALGVHAASQIEKITGVLAAIFLIVALSLSFMSVQQSEEPDVKIGGRSQQTTEPAGMTTIPAATTEPAKSDKGVKKDAATSPPKKAD